MKHFNIAFTDTSGKRQTSRQTFTAREALRVAHILRNNSGTALFWRSMEILHPDNVKPLRVYFFTL